MAYEKGSRPDSPMKKRRTQKKKSLRILWKRK